MINVIIKDVDSLAISYPKALQTIDKVAFKMVSFQYLFPGLRLWLYFII